MEGIGESVCIENGNDIGVCLFIGLGLILSAPIATYLASCLLLPVSRWMAPAGQGEYFGDIDSRT